MIRKRWGDSVALVQAGVEVEDVFHEHEDEDEKPKTMPDIEDSVDSTGRVINQKPFYDALINAEV